MRKKKSSASVDPFIRTSELDVNGKTITHGDIIKIRGVWGVRFKFIGHVRNPANGAEWIDCVELQRGVSCSMRSFHIERVKPLPKKRKRKKHGDNG